MDTIVTATLLADNTLKRVQLVSDFGAFPVVGRLNQLSIELSLIAGGASQFARLQLTWINDDNQIIVPTKTAEAFEIDPGDATKGSYAVDVGRLMSGQPAGATGIWLGAQLDVGTATLAIVLEASSRLGT